MLASASGFYYTPGLKNEVRIAYVLKISDLQKRDGNFIRSFKDLPGKDIIN